MQREARLPKQPCVSMQIYFFLYLSFHITIHSTTLFRDNIDESLLYSSDEEDPFFLMSPSAANEHVTVDQRLLADPLSSLEAVGVVLGAGAMIREGKLPFLATKEA